jgi:hypothetical protein
LTPTQLEEALDDDKLPGSFDDGDPQTTNLYVGNLSPQVLTIQQICIFPGGPLFLGHYAMLNPYEMIVQASLC